MLSIPRLQVLETVETFALASLVSDDSKDPEPISASLGKILSVPPIL